MTRVGLIGAGAMGRHVADLVCQASEHLEVSHVFDPDPIAIDFCRETFNTDFETCASVEAVLASKCDWVMIASMNCDHAQQTIAAFEAGKHVFCQKPLATTFADCLAMRDAWHQSGRQFVIGFTLRYSPHYRAIKALLEAGAIGEVISLEFNETLHFNHGGFIHGDWRRDSALAGSHVLEKCCHDIDIVNWLLESRARKVASFGGTNFFLPHNAHHIDRLGPSRSGQPAYSRVQRSNGRRGENPFTAEKDLLDNQVVILEYESDVRATFHMNSNTAIPERRLYLCGTEGTIRADVLTDTIEVQKIGYGTEVQVINSGTPGMHGGGDPILAQELIELMDGKRTTPAAGIDAGLIAAATCFAIDDAVQDGMVVELERYWQAVDTPD